MTMMVHYHSLVYNGAVMLVCASVHHIIGLGLDNDDGC